MVGEEGETLSSIVFLPESAGSGSLVADPADQDQGAERGVSFFGRLDPPAPAPASAKRWSRFGLILTQSLFENGDVLGGGGKKEKAPRTNKSGPFD